MAASNPAFAGLDEFVTTSIPYVTMDKLRQVIDVLNLQHRSTVGGAIKKAGKKADLVASVQDAVRAFKRQGNAVGYRAFKASWEAIINPWSSRPTPTFAKTAPTHGGGTLYAPPAAYSSYLGAGGYNYGGAYGGLPGAGSSHASSSTAPSYMNGGRPSSTTTYPLVAWKSTPGWKAIKALSDTYLLPAIEEGHASERRNKMATLMLSQADLDTVNTPTELGQPKKEIRLFCTSSDYYPTAIAAGDSVPLEFPYNSEITVDSKVVQFRKGLKGRANTAAPVPLDSAAHRLRAGQTNVSVTHVGPSLNKKTKEAKAMKASAAEDDIQLGSTKVSLKDPISYTRIINPARADFCSHVQCFDVAQWISVNETTPQYFQSILAMCPDTVDEVIIEPDGEWHTEDQKYASPGWRQAQKSESTAAAAAAGAGKANTPLDEKPQLDLDGDSFTNGTTNDNAGKSSENGRAGGSARMHEVVALDDSSDDEPIRRIAPRTIYTAPSSESRAREEASSVDRLLDTALYARSADSAGQSESTTAARTTATASDPIIDLTSTDDEDEDEDYSMPALPAWAADLPALARSDKRERSMSSLLEADDRHAMRRRLVEDSRDSSGESELVQA
ncbi:hypothetical protein QFC22_004085 [Naganishia vaughanmartiniae]|uniref:Uncharacterized protein n=1 Tax=Naganishia vaughanmartiniae TaxID=1424756 RepID=A0ACC2X545_9TREE|nr:hypothetical protein QFC22_004085 [Naganishia vaughanmartiniae]